MRFPISNKRDAHGTKTPNEWIDRIALHEWSLWINNIKMTFFSFSVCVCNALIYLQSSHSPVLSVHLAACFCVDSNNTQQIEYFIFIQHSNILCAIVQSFLLYFSWLEREQERERETERDSEWTNKWARECAQWRWSWQRGDDGSIQVHSNASMLHDSSGTTVCSSSSSTVRFSTLIVLFPNDGKCDKNPKS